MAVKQPGDTPITLEIGTRIRFRYAEGHWDKMGFQPSGRILYKYGVIERLPVESDRTAAIVRLDDGDATRISVVCLEETTQCTIT